MKISRRKIITAIKEIIIATVCVAMFIGIFWWLSPKPTYQDAIVISSECGVVTVEAEDGNVYQCYGQTDAKNVIITLEDGDRFVNFEEVQ